MDYHELGPDNASEVGLCAARATAVLRYARTTGDGEAYRRMLSTLELMESFRVPSRPRSGKSRSIRPTSWRRPRRPKRSSKRIASATIRAWLHDAVVWARRGLPFVYLWNDPERPFLLGATIPVFGATWMQGSWFGRPVQWNGLRYAEAILKLAEYDKSYPWRQIAATIIHSALYQQDTKGENLALWPDNLSAWTPRNVPGSSLRR